MSSGKTAPYGTWDSPITADALVQGLISISSVQVDPVTSTIFHVEDRPSEAGRSVLVHTASGRDVVGKEWNVRSGVQEYGGAAVTVYAGQAYFSHYGDGRIYRVAVEGGAPEAVTPDTKIHRFANFAVHPVHRHLLVAVVEDHTVHTAKGIITTLSVVDTRTQSISTLVSGADFYAAPSFSPDGTQIAWQEWYHPDMPWEGAEIHIAEISSSEDTLTLDKSSHIAGEKVKVSAGYPSWISNETVLFTSDKSGYQNPWKYSRPTSQTKPVLQEEIPEDFSGPAWLLGWSSYVALDSKDELVVFSAFKDGRNVLYVVDLKSGSKPQLLDSPYVEIHDLRRVPGIQHQFVFFAKTIDEPVSIIQATVSASAPYTVSFKTLKSTAKTPAAFPREIIPSPQPLSLTVAPNNEKLHVVYYPPTNPEYAGSSIPGEKPPGVFHIHGGPTSFTSQGVDWVRNYFTSRGWAWISVNYGGSSGYGRAYIQRLAGNWGVVDVEDSIHAVRALSSAPYNLVDPHRAVIRGGSAGGYTTLAALTIASDVSVFAAGTSLFGISDLRALVDPNDPHKFESRYTEKLVGGTLEEVPEVYEKRSPVVSADKIVSPLLILQGEVDYVVPKAQAELIVESVKSRGGVIEYTLYPGEGHGWRKKETIKDALEREIKFYEKVLGLKKD